MHVKSIAHLLLLCLFFAGFNASAQTGRYQNVRKFSGFKSTTTLIVLEDSNAAYNAALRAATDNGRWTVTPVKYIYRSELEPYLINPDYSMLIKNNQFKVVRRASGNDILRSNDVGVYRCNQGDLSNYATVDAIATIRLLDVMREEDYVYKLSGLIEAMHDYLLFLDNNAVRPDMHDKMMEQYFNARNAELADRKLLICEDEVDESLDPSRYYKNDVEVVEKSVIQQAVLEHQPGKAFIHMHPRKLYLMVIATENGQVLYYESLKTSKPFSKKNLSAIAKSIKKALGQ